MVSAIPDWPINPALLEKVVSLDISARSANALKNHGIVYIRDLVQRSEAELLRIPNFDKRSLNDVKEVLALMGLHLGMEVPSWSPDDIK